MARRGRGGLEGGCDRPVSEADHILDFTSDAIDSTSVAPLGDLWRPNSTPSRLAPLGYAASPTRMAARVPSDTSTSTWAALVVPGVLAGVVGWGCVRVLRSRAGHRRGPSSLVADLRDWQRARRLGG